MKNKIFYLTGFMGAGKSTIGPILANTLGWEYFDLDKVIEEKLDMKIVEIFEKYGEKFFREHERKILEEVSRNKSAIISLGGGTMANQVNIKLLKETGKIIYLKATISSLFKRLEFKRDRPNLKIQDGEPTEEKLIKRITELYNTREQYYIQSDFIVETDEKSIGVTVDRIARIIKEEDNKLKGKSRN